MEPPWADRGFTFLKTRSMGHPELMSTKSTSVLLLMSSAHLVMVSGKQPSTWRHNLDFRTEAIIKNRSSENKKNIAEVHKPFLKQ